MERSRPNEGKMGEVFDFRVEQVRQSERGASITLGQIGENVQQVGVGLR